MGQLQQQRGLAYSRLAGQQRHRTRNNAPTEDTVKLGRRQSDSGQGVGGQLRQLKRLAAVRAGPAGTAAPSLARQPEQRGPRSAAGWTGSGDWDRSPSTSRFRARTPGSNRLSCASRQPSPYRSLSSIKVLLRRLYGRRFSIVCGQLSAKFRPRRVVRSGCAAQIRRSRTFLHSKRTPANNPAITRTPATDM